jgi:hypothetical protein
MTTKTIERRKLHRPKAGPKPSPHSKLREVDAVVIQVTQLFCPKGHNLVRDREHLFDGQMGLCLWVSDGEKAGEVILSPFHGDHRRLGLTDFAKGTRLTIACPICKAPLPRLSACGCKDKGDLVKLYLTPELSEENLVALCNVWGCHRSKVFDQAQLLSAYIEEGP